MCCLKDLVWCLIFTAFFTFIGLLMLVVYMKCINIEETGFECDDYWDRIFDLFKL